MWYRILEITYSKELLEEYINKFAKNIKIYIIKMD